ncbi:glycosyl transferase group 1 (plasmid) [Gloeothece citriformis PCC 7424]|uniref:Glycosyl transferase group 1 n=1 Tax=Gloeothece citriformis (strain PCC 7424) TaxID=65393 RepID=B7KM27_GLOC7|nr:glycosyltransferase family 4 protein [Gloeothece citriformis]ACK73849.1 glycosyl transferase group 1 [Gloeothece citriformis PCC 7424]
MSSLIKVFLVCTGVGIINRGIETFARECFDGLKGSSGLQMKLFKGAGLQQPDEYRLWNIPRTSNIANILGKCVQRNGYVVEQWSSFFPLIPHLKKEKPDIIFYSDSNLGFQLYWWRKQIGVPYKLLFSNGGPCGPPFSRTDHVHQVAPFYREIALAAGEPASKHSLVPYGINVPDGLPLFDDQVRSHSKTKLGLPSDRPIVLSVGWISAQHKRMDYTINEIASLPEPRPYLVMLGYIDDNSQAIIDLARRQLGESGFTARCVPYEQVAQYYQVADVFALGSLQEGFGRVYLEALIQGLPCIVNDHPVMRYVLDTQGTFADLSKLGSMAQAITDILKQPRSPEVMIKRREYVWERFSWKNLAPYYLEMFGKCLQQKVNILRQP